MMAGLDLFATDAFSFYRYGPRNWADCIQALRREKFVDEDIATILGSTWTRHIADGEGKDAGCCTAKYFIRQIRLIRRDTPHDLPRLLEQGRSENKHYAATLAAMPAAEHRARIATALEHARAASVHAEQVVAQAATAEQTAEIAWMTYARVQGQALDAAEAR